MLYLSIFLMIYWNTRSYVDDGFNFTARNKKDTLQHLVGRFIFSPNLDKSSQGRSYICV